MTGNLTSITRQKDAILNFLASNPSGNATASSRSIVRAIMLATGGRMLACGYDHNVVSRPLGGGVYRITLERI